MRMLPSMEKLIFLFCVFVTVGTTAAKPIEGDASSLSRVLNVDARVRPKRLVGTPDIHVSRNARHVNKGEHFDLFRQFKDALLQRRMNQEVLKSWFDDDPSIRGTSTITSRETTQTTAPTSTTEETTTTTAATTTQDAIQTAAPPDFWEIFWKLWKTQHNPFG